MTTAKPSHYFLAGLTLIALAAFCAELSGARGIFPIVVGCIGVAMILMGPIVLEMDNDA